LTKTFNEGAFIQNNKMEVNINQDEFLMDTESICIRRKHNMKNAMAATSVAKLMQIRKATIRESLSSFQGVEHRLEKY
jgi:UDP-N-acetylmuramoylalanine--D-glutamate ligase